MTATAPAPPRIPAHTLFFPAGALYAALVLPASVFAMLGIAPPIAGLAFPAGHAHELLFGFALAAVAGNQLGPTPRPLLAWLLGTWVAARVAFLAAPGAAASALANGAFAALLAWQLAPRLFIRAKKLRNRAMPVAIAALCLSAVAVQVSFRAGSAPLQRTLLLTAILLLALLMLFMGGRIIAPAAAGHMYREGEDLAARVQPRIEAALIVAMFVAIVACAAGAARLAGVAAIASAALAIVRMARWRLWKLARRPDLLCLAAGYGWLALGLAALGAALLAGQREVAALHVITVGAMGTLTINVMALTWLRLARRDPARASLPVWATGLVALATVARVAADFVPGDRRAWLVGAALAWSAAYALLLVLMARVRRARA